MVAGHGYLSGNSPVLHFGLGSASEADLKVRWPSGQVDEYKGLAARRVWTLVEGDPKAAKGEELRKIEVAPAAPKPAPADPDPREILAGLKTLDGAAAGPFPGPTLVVVFSVDCHACVEELKRMAELEEEAGKLGVRIAWVTKDANLREVAERFRLNAAPAPPFQSSVPLADASVPCVYLVTPSRVEKYVGRFAVSAALEDAAVLK
jgi:thiol-disulfide isomerase/thioredoxin